MLEYTVEQEVYDGLVKEPGKKIIGSLYRKDGLAGENIGTVVGYAEGFENLEVVTGIRSDHSFSEEDTEKVASKFLPHPEFDSNAQILLGRYRQEGMIYTAGLQFNETDMDGMGLGGEGWHTYVIHANLGAVKSHEEFTKKLDQYVAFVNTYFSYINRDEEGSSEPTTMSLTSVPNDEMGDMTVHRLCAWDKPDEYEFKLGYQGGPGSPGTMNAFLAKAQGPGAELFKTALGVVDPEAESHINLDDMLWTDRSRTWDTLFLLDGPYQDVQLAVSALKNPDAFRGRSIDPYKHAKLFFSGPSGMGKSLFAEALSLQVEHEVDGVVEVYRTTYGDLSSKLRGIESKNMKNLFAQLQEKLQDGKTVVWFMEELQQIGVRDHIHTQNNEVLDELLVYLGECHTWGPVLFIGASAECDYQFDPQLVRFGRLGKQIKFDHPQNGQAEEFVQWRVDYMEQRREGDIPIFAELDVNRIVQAVEVPSFSNLDNVLETPVTRNLQTSLVAATDYRPVTTDDIAGKVSAPETEAPPPESK